MDHYEVLGIGAPFLDHIVQVDHEFLEKYSFIKGGMEVFDYETFVKVLNHSGPTVKLVAGGSSSNMIKGLANLGHSTALTGKIGKDKGGEKFIESIRKLGIIPLYTTTNTPTGQVICLVTPDGERTLRDYLGSGQEMRGEDLNPQHFTGVKLVHIEGYTLLNKDLTLQAMKLAKEANAMVSFDLANFELVEEHRAKIMEVISKHIDILFANKAEAEVLTGLGPEESAKILKDLFEVVVITMGPQGCWVGHKDQVQHYPAYPTKAVDTTGAGDLFSAGFLHGYLTGQPWEKCAHFGALLGAEVVKVFGAEIPKESWDFLRNKIIDRERIVINK